MIDRRVNHESSFHSLYTRRCLIVFLLGGALCSVSLPLAGDTSQSVSTGSSDSAENCPPCPPTCATVQLYNVTALTGDGSGGMGTVLLQTTPQASAPVPATYGSAPVPSTCSAVE